MKFKISMIIIAVALLTACSSAPEESAPTLTPTEQQGQAVFKLRCAQCHALTPDTTVIGPSLAGIATRASTRMDGYDAPSYIEHSILFPKDYLVEGYVDTMPTNFGKELTSDDLSSVVAYLMTLK